MSLGLSFRERAREDVVAAADYYGAFSHRLVARFMEDLGSCLEIIQQYPGGFRSIRGSIRQAPLRSFPFVIVYAVVKHELVILRVFHTSQAPSKRFSE